MANEKNLLPFYNLLKMAFNSDGLDIFCHQYFPDVSQQLSSQMLFDEKVRILIDYCHRNLELKNLLERIREVNPTQYAGFEEEFVALGFELEPLPEVKMKEDIEVISREPDLERIQKLLIEGFSEQELRELCTFTPVFKEINKDLSEGMSQRKIVNEIINYAKRKKLIDELLAWTKEKNIARYNQHGPYFVISKPTLTTEDSGSYTSQPFSTTTESKQTFNFKKLIGQWGTIGLVIIIIIILVYQISILLPIISSNSTSTLTPAVNSPSTPSTAKVNVVLLDFAFKKGNQCLSASMVEDIAVKKFLGDFEGNSLSKDLKHKYGIPPKDLILEADNTYLCNKEDAVNWAKEKNIDLVVWGIVEVNTEPKYHLNFTVLDLNEKTGVSSGLSGLLEDDVQSLNDKIKTWVFVNQGLDAYLQGTCREAINLFNAGNIDENQINLDNLGVWGAVEMFRGRCKLALGEIKEAREIFNKVLAESCPDNCYTWAYIGLASMDYGEVERDYQENGKGEINCVLLDRAENNFNLALGVGWEDYIYFVKAKAYYGLGNVQLIRYNSPNCENKLELGQIREKYEHALAEYECSNDNGVKVCPPEAYKAAVYYSLALIDETNLENESARENYLLCMKYADETTLFNNCENRLNQLN